jgi:alpha-D-ribose 1-methylphosphonate 5-triphosphate synthase subunit PhnH
VAMALETVALLAEEMSADDAIMHYVRYFSLPSVEAQIIFRRTLAAWADRHPVRELMPTGASVCAAAPAVPFTHRVPLTLRIAG